jgi:hypothetical protein
VDQKSGPRCHPNCGRGGPLGHHRAR